MPALELVLPSAGSSLSCSAIWSARPRWPLASIQRICGKCLAAYRAAVAEVVAGFGGYVAKYMGDGVLAYFGYPQAHEHDAEQAVTGRSGADRPRRPAGERRHRVGEPGRHRHRPRRRRRSDRLGRGAGARGCRRDAEPRSPSTRNGASERGAGRRKHAAAGWRSLRLPRSRGCHDQGAGRAGIGLASARREHGREPFRGIAFGDVEPARRPRRGSPVAVATVGPGQGRRRSDRADFRRGRHRQVPDCCGIAGAARTRAAYPVALFLLAAPSRQRALSDYCPA